MFSRNSYHFHILYKQVGGTTNTNKECFPCNTTCFWHTTRYHNIGYSTTAVFPPPSKFFSFVLQHYWVLINFDYVLCGMHECMCVCVRGGGGGAARQVWILELILGPQGTV